MSTHLHHLVARQQIADHIRAAERARLAQGTRPVEPASARGGLIARLLVQRRLRLARPVPAEAGCADECVP
jgi:alanyl-tRNA synthetase